MIRPTTLLIRFCAAVLLMAVVTAPARAADLADARATLAKSAQVVEKVRSDKNFADWFDDKLARARAVMVIPSFYKGAFFIGGAYGNGVLTVRDDAGTFSPPSFVRMIGGSLGLQFGGQEGQLLFLIMTQAGLDAILQDQFKIGANVGVTFGTIGANMEAATTSNMEKDVLVFGHARGAFGGGALEGAGIEPRHEWNRAVYGANATPKAILFDRRWTWDEAQPLYTALKGTPVHPQTGPAATQGGTSGQPAPVATPVDDGSASGPAPAPVDSPAPARLTAPASPGAVETMPLDDPAPAPSDPSDASGDMSSSSAPSGQESPAAEGTTAGQAPVRLVPTNRQDLQ